MRLIDMAFAFRRNPDRVPCRPFPHLSSLGRDESDAVTKASGFVPSALADGIGCRGAGPLARDLFAASPNPK